MRRASELAQRQFGPIARWQLLRFGFGPSRIKRWVAGGRLFPVYPGVYAWGRPELPESGELAAGLLFAGAGSAIGGLSDLWWRGLLRRRPELIHIDAPGHVASRQDLLIRHPKAITREWHDGLPIVPLPEALLRATAFLSLNALRLVLARAEYERSLSLPSLQAAIGEGRAGSRALRAAIEAHLPQLARCVNGFEREFVLLCERSGLPIPEPNPRIGRYRPDMLWRDRMLIVELDGGRAHSTPAQLVADAKRQAALEAMGYTVIRFTWTEVHCNPDLVLARLRRFLAA